VAGAPADAAGARASAAKPAVAQAPAPFAKVYLALRGCTSCAHCRTTIRQMTKGSAQGGEARVNGDQVEVSYAKPRVLPLRDVIKTLSENRLHDLNLVDVLFEANGSFAKGADGVLRFTLAETGQAFPVAVTAPIERPADGRTVRLVAVVDGWRGKGGLSLVAREVRPAA
ncbi:MAG TPA: hypothetical protein VFU59_12375, partial [Candidatus Eisenbacteria bacterium]|nr:hypothetical protein [Candidatus Eisenbacteria bacterium]